MLTQLFMQNKLEKKYLKYNVQLWHVSNSLTLKNNVHLKTIIFQYAHLPNQSTEGAEFVWVSECQKGEGVVRL
jgi:hypothetical protein